MLTLILRFGDDAHRCDVGCVLGLSRALVPCTVSVVRAHMIRTLYRWIRDPGASVTMDPWVVTRPMGDWDTAARHTATVRGVATETLNCFDVHPRMHARARRTGCPLHPVEFPRLPERRVIESPTG